MQYPDHLIAPRPGVDHWHPLSSSLIPVERAPHANRGTFKRPHFDRRLSRLRIRKAFLVGAINNSQGLSANGKRSLASYRHSSTARQEAPLAMAA